MDLLKDVHVKIRKGEYLGVSEEKKILLEGSVFGHTL
jgi:hypothetical protein